MLAIFAMGIVVGVMAVIGILKLTMGEEPSGCLLAFGSIFTFFLLVIMILLW